MAKYLEFETRQAGPILIEVSEHAPFAEVDLEAEPSQGPSKVGLVNMAGNAVLKAQTLFQEAIETALRVQVETFYSAIQALPHPPSDIEITFGLKAIGELNNVAVGKLGTESNYTIKLTWKSSQAHGQNHEAQPPQ